MDESNSTCSEGVGKITSENRKKVSPGSRVRYWPYTDNETDGISEGDETRELFVKILSGAHAGAVHVFDAKSHTQVAEIISPWVSFSDRFGHAITCDGDFMLVGMDRRAFNDDRRYPRALMYDLQTLEIVKEFVPSRGSELAGFGSGVALSSEYAIVGMSPERNIQSTGHTGAAFVYVLGDQACSVDLNDDGTLNYFDISAFLVGYSAGDLAMDFNGDGDLNFFDVSAFLIAYQEGCP